MFPATAAVGHPRNKVEKRQPIPSVQTTTVNRAFPLLSKPKIAAT